MNDADLLALYFARDERASNETYRKFGGYCYTIANNILGSDPDAEECVNDVLLRLWEKIPPAKPDNFYAYIATITRNIARNRYRKENAQKRGGSETPLALDELRDCTGPDTVEQELDSRVLGGVIDKFLGTLKEQHRIIFVQRYWYLCSVEDIAEDLGISKSNVTVTLMRTRLKLRNYLEKEGFL